MALIVIVAGILRPSWLQLPPLLHSQASTLEKVVANTAQSGLGKIILGRKYLLPTSSL